MIKNHFSFFSLPLFSILYPFFFIPFFVFSLSLSLLLLSISLSRTLWQLFLCLLLNDHFIVFFLHSSFDFNESAGEKKVIEIHYLPMTSLL